MDEYLLALLIANEVQSTHLVLSQTRCSSNITVLAAFDTIADEESTSRDDQRAVQSRRRRRHHQEMQLFLSPYGFSVEWIGCYSRQQPLCFINIQFNTEPIFALDFLSDGSSCAFDFIGTSAKYFAAMSIQFAQFKWRPSTVTMASFA